MSPKIEIQKELTAENKQLALSKVPRAGIEPARTLLSKGF